MATKKPAVPADEKLEDQDLNLFDVLAAMDRKDYDYYDKLSEAQQKKVAPYILVQWMSAIKSSGGLAAYYLMSTDYNANKHLLNEHVSKHPKLQWLMLCAASPGMGKQFHQWIPHIKQNVSLLKETAKLKDTQDYFKKVYPKANAEMLKEISEEFVRVQKRKFYLSQMFPTTKLADIETLNELITDEEVNQYEKDRGN